MRFGRILILHASYQVRGGEDRAVHQEAKLLLGFGHDVRVHTVDNRDLSGAPLVSVAIGSVWNHRKALEVRQLLEDFRPDVVHVHNTFPGLSPSVLYECTRAEIPLVATLHNYRLLCANGLLYRSGSACELCVGRRFALPAVVHRCYRGSLRGSTVVVASMALHRMLRTYIDQVDAFVALTGFAKDKFIEGGLPARRIHVRPNSSEPPEGRASSANSYMIYAGRLSREKGLRTLIEAWRELSGLIPMKIIGDGPLRDELSSSGKIPGVELVGRLRRAEVARLMQGATALVVPSECYEGFPMVIAEALSIGLPIIGSRLGAIQSILQDTGAGITHEPRDPDSLAQAARHLWSDRELRSVLSESGLRAYHESYSPIRSYERLIEVYEAAGRRSAQRRGLSSTPVE